MQNSPHSCLFLTPTPHNCGGENGHDKSAPTPNSGYVEIYYTQ